MASRYHPDLLVPHSISLCVCCPCACLLNKRPDRCCSCFSDNVWFSASNGLGICAKAHVHTLAGNGANRRGLQAHDGAFCLRLRGHLQRAANPGFSASPVLCSIALRAYSSSTTSSMFCERSNVHHFLLKVACCFRGNKKPLALRGVSNIASSPHLADTQRLRRNWHPFSLHCEGGCRVSQGRSLHPS